MTCRDCFLISCALDKPLQVLLFLHVPAVFADVSEKTLLHALGVSLSYNRDISERV